jgi:hypothetical protein
MALTFSGGTRLSISFFAHVYFSVLSLACLCVCLFLCLLHRIDPTGEFSRQRQLSCLFWTYLKSTSDIIKQELRYVLDISQSKIDRLEQASDLHIGKCACCLPDLWLVGSPSDLP